MIQHARAMKYLRALDKKESQEVKFKKRYSQKTSKRYAIYKKFRKKQENPE